MEYCSRVCQRRHWKTHKPGHFKAIADTNEKKRVAAEEAKDFPVVSFTQHVNAAWDESPEVRGLLVNILKAYTEKKCEGLLVYTNEVLPPARYGKYYPLRFIGNADIAHSEMEQYTAKEVPSIEVEHCMGCESEKRAKSFLYGFAFESMELDPDLYRKFWSEVMTGGFWMRIDGEKQYDLRAREWLSRGHIAPVPWDGSKEVLNSAGQIRGLDGHVFDKSRVEAKYLRDAEDGLRWSQETIDASAATDYEAILSAAGVRDPDILERARAARVTPQREESP